MRPAFVIATALVFLAACGSSSDSGDSGAEKAELVVGHVLDRSSGVLYMEGSIWHIRVLDSKGRAILDRKLVAKSISLALDPGRYRLESEELPCDGNCGHLDAGTDGCSAEFEAGSGDTLAATVTLKPSQGCVIEFRPKPRIIG